MISNWYTFVPTIFLEINNSLWDKTQKITRLLGHFPFYYRTTSHFAIFLHHSQKSLLFSLFSIPGIPPFLLCSLHSSLLGHFLLITGRLASHFFPGIPLSLLLRDSFPPFFFAFNPKYRNCILFPRFPNVAMCTLLENGGAK